MSDHKHTPKYPITDDHKNWWFDRPGSIKLIVNGLYAVCFLLFVADFFLKKHPHFVTEKDAPYQEMIETFPNFYGFYGFIGCFFLVVAAAQLRKILMRDEDYYQRKEKRK